MMPNAIVYTSNTGYTRQYALMLAKQTGLPVYSLEESVARLPAGNSIIYLGWLMAGKVQGYPKAAKRYPIATLCGVGMMPTGTQVSQLRKSNHLPESLPVFPLQGGFSLDRLHGIHKAMMTLMVKALANKNARTPEEADMLSLLQGGSRVSQENLQAVLDWYTSSH